MVHVGYICSLWSPKIMSWALYHPAFKEVAIGHGNGFLLGFHWYVRLPVVVISESAWGIQLVACLRMFCMRLYFCVHLLPCFFGWYRGKKWFPNCSPGILAHLLRIVMEPKYFAFGGEWTTQYPNHPLTFGDWIPRAHPPLQVPVVGGYSGSMSGPSVVPLFSQERPTGCLERHPWKLTWNPKINGLGSMCLFFQFFFQFQLFVFGGKLPFIPLFLGEFIHPSCHRTSAINKVSRNISSICVSAICTEDWNPSFLTNIWYIRFTWVTTADPNFCPNAASLACRTRRRAAWAMPDVPNWCIGCRSLRGGWSADGVHRGWGSWDDPLSGSKFMSIHEEKSVDFNWKNCGYMIGVKEWPLHFMVNFMVNDLVIMSFPKMRQRLSMA